MNEAFEIRANCPLEIYLKEIVEKPNSHNDFPHIGMDRFQLYTSIKSKLDVDNYRDIASALSAKEDGAAFTRHDLGHVNDVIRRAGQILGANSDSDKPALKRLKSYEVFVLLVACLIHDAGNIDGRKGHAKRTRKVLRQVSGGFLDEKEMSLISKIASAHGGETTAGSKDTIGELTLEDGVDSATVRPRLLASILRLADELAENSRRANKRDEEESQYPNLFCKCISSRIDYISRRIALNFTISDADCALMSKDETGKKMYFLDYISKRVSKTELERRYCDRFLRGFATFDQIRIHIELLKNDHEWHTIHFEMKDDGYPNVDNLEQLTTEINARDIAKQYKILCEKEAKKNA